jgi:hypothetical protein
MQSALQPSDLPSDLHRVLTRPTSQPMDRTLFELSTATPLVQRRVVLDSELVY